MFSADTRGIGEDSTAQRSYVRLGVVLYGEETLLWRLASNYPDSISLLLERYCGRLISSVCRNWPYETSLHRSIKQR